MTPLRDETKAVRLTRQQRQIMLEFGRPDDPFDQSSETISYCGVREWPTCDNLIKLNLIERERTLGNDGWIYFITDAGIAVLRGLR